MVSPLTVLHGSRMPGASSDARRFAWISLTMKISMRAAAFVAFGTLAWTLVIAHKERSLEAGFDIEISDTCSAADDVEMCLAADDDVEMVALLQTKAKAYGFGDDSDAGPDPFGDRAVDSRIKDPPLSTPRDSSMLADTLSKRFTVGSVNKGDAYADRSLEGYGLSGGLDAGFPEKQALFGRAFKLSRTKGPDSDYEHRRLDSLTRLGDATDVLKHQAESLQQFTESYINPSTPAAGVDLSLSPNNSGDAEELRHTASTKLVPNDLDALSRGYADLVTKSETDRLRSMLETVVKQRDEALTQAERSANAFHLAQAQRDQLLVQLEDEDEDDERDDAVSTVQELGRHGKGGRRSTQRGRKNGSARVEPRLAVAGALILTCLAASQHG